MTRVHDMGGRFGDGPVVPELQGIVPFAADWHQTALSLTVASGALGKWNIDTSRHARESLSPKDYARFSYYEKWIAALADLLVETGLIDTEELKSGQAQLPAAPDDFVVTAPRMAKVLAAGAPATRDCDVRQRFEIGQRVRTLRPAANRLVNGGHTRLPSYAAGAQGRILRCHGAHVLPDSNAHGLGEAPEPLYAVVFAAGELWAAPENPGDEVVLDLWQSYLEHS
ncbi:MAG: nitrile hydratase beta subunit [Paracoccaceae bacterium]|jgi:nitrile hydratase beta subunit